MKKKVWYGYSKEDNRVHFFDTDRNVGSLQGTGTFTLDGEIEGLNIETVGNDQREPARA